MAFKDIDENTSNCLDNLIITAKQQALKSVGFGPAGMTEAELDRAVTVAHAEVVKAILNFVEKFV